ncbi:ANR35 protein, partial [Onychorhynchus coronatus]|nr:ANR35 protein [Onychorhynchus coronatus]
RSLGALRERAARLERACRDKDGKLKQLLVETEKLSAEVLGLRGRSTRLELQLEVGTAPRVTPAIPCHPVSPPVAPCHPVPRCHPVSPVSPPSQVQQKQHRDTVAVYRTHLLRAAQGFMDGGVHAALLRILRDQAGAG